MPTEPSKTDDDEPRDIVTEASMDSFPASDPPGWIRQRAAASDSEPVNVEAFDVVDLPAPDAAALADLADERPSATSGPHLRRTKRILIATGVALAAGAITAFFVVRSRRRARA